MAEPILVDFIELHARGITDIDAELKKLKGSMADAESAHEKLLSSLNDPTYRKKIGELVELKKHESDLARAERSRLDTARQAAALQSRIRDVESGQFGKQLQTQAGLARLDATVRDAERRAELRYKYGRFGGTALAGMQDVANSRGGRLASVAGTGMFGAAMSGFSNTVEMNRLGGEITLISRELAGALKPAIELTTNALQSIRKVLEQMGPAGQNALMALMMIGAARFAYGRVGGLVSAVAPSIGAGTARAATASTASKLAAGAGFAGFGSAPFQGGTLANRGAGRVMQSTAGGVTKAAGASAAMNAGTLAASSGGGLAASIARAGAIGAIAAGSYMAFSSPRGRAETLTDLGVGKKTSSYGESLLSSSNPAAFLYDTGKGLAKSEPIGPMRFAGDAIADTLGREKKIKRFKETFSALGFKGETIGDYGDWIGGKQGEKAREKRRSVTPADAGFEAIGSGYERIANDAALKLALNNEEADAATVENTSAIQNLTKMISESLGFDPNPIGLLDRLRGRS